MYKMGEKLVFGLYHTLIRLGDVYIFLGSWFSQKLKSLHYGRSQTWHILEENHKKSNLSCKKIWIHCASLGEFEQGRPLIEKFKKEQPHTIVYLSFFSPSGYEIQKHYDKADFIFYLPSDTTKNANRLIQLIKPDMVIFVKYEFWWQLILCLHHYQIPVFLISAVFRDKDYFWYDAFKPFQTLLKKYTQIFVQDNTSAQVLTKQGFTNFNITGDTRIDRVIQRSKQLNLPEKFSLHVAQKPIIIYGSAWMSDMDIITATVKSLPAYNHIIAPHDVSVKNIELMGQALGHPFDLYSDNQWKSNVLFINNIGLLSTIYAVAKYAYIGGGFQKGIHNILEPAVFKIPVFFGPNHTKFNEATELIALQAAFTIQNPSQLKEKIKNLDNDPSDYQIISQRLESFFHQNQGATESVYKTIKEIVG